MQDRFNLERFVNAQEAVFPQVLDELHAGAKRTHWIWFIFPQMKGLGHGPQASSTASARWKKPWPICGIPFSAPAWAMHAAGHAGGGTHHSRDPRLARRPEVPLLDDSVCPRSRGRRDGFHRLQRRLGKILQRRG